MNQRENESEISINKRLFQGKRTLSTSTTNQYLLRKRTRWTRTVPATRESEGDVKKLENNMVCVRERVCVRKIIYGLWC